MEFEEITPLTIRRRDYILGHLAKDFKSENWIRIAYQEYVDFGGRDFFIGCRIDHLTDNSWYLTNAKGHWDGPQRKVQLNIKIIVPGGGPWTPHYTNAPLHEGKQKMQEHHIKKEDLLRVIRENKERYATVYARFKALYADEVEALTHKHLDGLIPTSQIVVKDKDGAAMTMPIDMSETYDKQTRELELDSREVVILTHEEYGIYIESNATNIGQVDTSARKLEELT